MGKRSRQRLRTVTWVDAGRWSEPGQAVSGLADPGELSVSWPTGRRSDPAERRGAGAGADHLGTGGDTLAALWELCRVDPADLLVHELYAEAIQQAHDRAGASPAAPCGCGSERPYRSCCRTRDRRALRHFNDREPLYRLRSALLDYFEDPDFDPVRRNALEVWFGEDAVGLHEELPGHRDGTKDALSAYEWAFSLLPVHGDGAPDDCLLSCFAGNLAVPPQWAHRAEDWLVHGRWGVWQCFGAATPGVWLTDLVAGTRRYVNIAPEQVEHALALGAFVGQILPVDGIWRTGGSLVLLEPEKAQELASIVLKTREQFIEDGRARGRGPRREEGRGRRSLLGAAPVEEVSRLSSSMVGLMAPVAAGRPTPGLGADGAKVALRRS
jgi:hypothetical protein